MTTTLDTLSLVDQVDHVRDTRCCAVPLASAVAGAQNSAGRDLVLLVGSALR
jgi:hypothetical protein